MGTDPLMFCPEIIDVKNSKGNTLFLAFLGFIAFLKIFFFSKPTGPSPLAYG